MNSINYWLLPPSKMSTKAIAKWLKSKLLNSLHNLAMATRKAYNNNNTFYLTWKANETFSCVFNYIIKPFFIYIFTAPRQLQAILATIEQRRYQPEPNFGRSEHNPRSITATDQVIPDLASHAWHWFGCQIHWCWCCNSRCRWFRFVLVTNC